MHVVGLDIGGANLKAASTTGAATSRTFPLWRQPERLGNQLREMLSAYDAVDALAVTMTGELADCFQTKAEGVDSILRAVEEAAAGLPVHVWQTGAEFVSPEVARDIPLLVAAANWHALATWLGRMAPTDAALLIDVGSTTTDVIPLHNGMPMPQGLTDVERLQSGELVYSGVRRTPLCAIAHSVPFRAGHCQLAAELFATTLDLYLLLGLTEEDPSSTDTANGKPATRGAAHDRIARMLCSDRNEIALDEAEQIARFLADVQRQRIVGAIDRVLRELAKPVARVLVSGEGTFLAERIVREHVRLRGAEMTSLAAILDPDSARCACAVAVARLAAERA